MFEKPDSKWKDALKEKEGMKLGLKYKQITSWLLNKKDKKLISMYSSNFWVSFALKYVLCIEVWVYCYIFLKVTFIYFILRKLWITQQV